MDDQREKMVRMEAASQAIEKTIQTVEESLGVKFPRGSRPSESREIMGHFLYQLRPDQETIVVYP